MAEVVGCSRPLRYFYCIGVSVSLQRFPTEKNGTDLEKLRWGLMGFNNRSIPPTAQIWKDQKWREEKRKELLANVLRPLCPFVDRITIESRAMSDERNQWGRLSVEFFAIADVDIADRYTVKTWNIVLSVGQVRPLA